MQDADRDMITWEYHAHARKAAYAVAGEAVSVALLPNSDVLRMLHDEGACFLCRALSSAQSWGRPCLSAQLPRCVRWRSILKLC